MKVLGIETSCDETSASIVQDINDVDQRIISHRIFSQLEEHKPYSGVVPEIAARSHLDKIESIIQGTLDDAHMDLDELDAISVTAGPGLIGGVIVGLMTAKALSASRKIPLICVNHLEGHALTARLAHENVAFPYLLLLISGGHCQYLCVEEVGKYKLLGSTIDDALGEAFDKTAKMLGLGYPGGVIVEELANHGDKHRFTFPTPLKGRKNCDFSFSGLKTAVRRELEKIGFDKVSDQDIKDVCASFQYTVQLIIKDRTKHAVKMFKDLYPHGENLVVGGGVGANQAIRSTLEEIAKKNQLHLYYPPIKLCTDNGAMIAWAGLENFKKGNVSALDFSPKPRWSLESLNK